MPQPHGAVPNGRQGGKKGSDIHTFPGLTHGSSL